MAPNYLLVESVQEELGYYPFNMRFPSALETRWSSAVHPTCWNCSFFKVQFKSHYLDETTLVFLMKTQGKEQFTYTPIMTLNTSSFLFKGRGLHFRLFCLPKRLEVHPVLYILPKIQLNDWKIFWTYAYFCEQKLSEWIADQTEERSGIWVIRAI